LVSDQEGEGGADRGKMDIYYLERGPGKTKSQATPEKTQFPYRNLLGARTPPTRLFRVCSLKDAREEQSSKRGGRASR